MALKIAIIGGGSAYAPGLIQAFIHKAAVFHGAELALMDIAAEELEIVARLGRRLAEAQRSEHQDHSHAKPKRSHSRARTLSYQPFGRAVSKRATWMNRYPLLHDIIGQETIGPGGFFFAMRTLPVIQSILDDIQSSAPGAILVNYTNPTQIVAEAVAHFSPVPCISICDQTHSDQEKILQAMNMPDARVELESVGLNHATWSTHFTINGEDGIQVMKRHLEAVLKRPDIEARLKRQFQLAVEFGRLPNSYMQYYYYREETLAEAKAAPKTRAQLILDSLPGYYQHFKEQSQAENPRLTHVRGGSVFGDMAVEVISALIRKDGSVHTLNIPNRSALPDFAPDRIVEVPARVGMGSVTPLVQDKFPSEILGLLHMLAEYQWLAAQSIWSGDRKAMEHALAANPLVLSLSTARKMLDQMIPLLNPGCQLIFIIFSILDSQAPPGRMGLGLIQANKTDNLIWFC